jgi:hypothetical protein
MDAMSDTHRHADRFDFALPRNTAVFVCERIKKGAPVLHVSHDSDGEWQFLCGGDQHAEGQSDGPSVACLECVAADDPTLNELSDLCGDWSAERDRIGHPWRRHDHGEDFIKDAVERWGWSIQLIEAGESESEPTFAYTVGLYKTFAAPELIVTGLPHDVMGKMLNTCGERIKQGEVLPLGEPISEIVDGLPVMLRRVRSRESYRKHVGYAIWFNDGADFPLCQLVWPDKAGRFPGDPEANPAFATLQALLE